MKLREGSHPYLVVSWNKSTPQIIHFNGIFHYKPSSYGGFPIYGNLHLVLSYVIHGMEDHTAQAQKMARLPPSSSVAITMEATEAGNGGTSRAMSTLELGGFEMKCQL